MFISLALDGPNRSNIVTNLPRATIDNQPRPFLRMISVQQQTNPTPYRFLTNMDGRQELGHPGRQVAASHNRPVCGPAIVDMGQIHITSARYGRSIFRYGMACLICAFVSGLRITHVNYPMIVVEEGQSQAAACDENVHVSVNPRFSASSGAATVSL